MRVPTIRYESNNFLISPIVLGIRHFKLAICNGSQDALLHLAKERVIYRPFENDNRYEPLTISRRIYHIIVGTLETVGYLTLIIPFITAIADCFFNRPFCPKGEYSLRVHLEEGGMLATIPSLWRRNPFDQNGMQDSFYQGASWFLDPNEI